MQDSPMLTPDEAARFLALSPKTLARWRWAGRGPGFVKLGSAVRYSQRQLDEFVSAGQVRL